jgi:hypothetical protein
MLYIRVTALSSSIMILSAIKRVIAISTMWPFSNYMVMVFVRRPQAVHVSSVVMGLLFRFLQFLLGFQNMVTEIRKLINQSVCLKLNLLACFKCTLQLDEECVNSSEMRFNFYKHFSHASTVVAWNYLYKSDALHNSFQSSELKDFCSMKCNYCTEHCKIVCVSLVLWGLYMIWGVGTALTI